MAINRRGGVYRSDTSIGEGIAAIDSAIDQAEAAQLAAEQARDAALVAQTAAELAETNAETAETNAELAEANAEAAQLASEAARDLALGYANAADADRIAAEAAKLAAENARDAALIAETNAETAETNAEAAQLAAENARDAAQLAYDNFDDRYLGPKASDPTLDNDGNALVTGALYFNTTSSEFKGYNGTSWISLPATTASNVAFSATGNIAATNVQTAIAEVDSEKVAKAGDTMTGTLVVPAVQMDTPFSFRNKIINGNFDIWQRGASGSGGSTFYTADRWKLELSGDSGSCTRQSFTPGQTDVPHEPSFFARYSNTHSVGAGNYTIIRQVIENVTTLAGKTAVVSFYAKATSACNVGFEMEQVFVGSGPVPFASQPLALTTTWQKFTLVVSVPSIAGKTLSAGHALIMSLWMSAGSSFAARASNIGQQSITVDLAQVQIEEGSVATPFEHRPYGLELSLCQRYYEKGTFRQIGYVPAGNFMGGSWSWKVTKRATPNVTGSATYSQMSGLTQGQVSAEHIYLYAAATVTGGNVWIYDFAADSEL